MAEAGWPLRTETFYYSHRKGGPQVLPVDVAAFVRSLLPRPADDDYRYLAEHSYEMGSGFKAAIGTPTMKFADDANRGKESVPGRPVLWRRIRVAVRSASSARMARPRPRATRPGAHHRPIRSTPSSSAPKPRRSSASSGGPDSRPGCCTLPIARVCAHPSASHATLGAWLCGVGRARCHS
jgi:hypothetical protein